jgi:pyrimidine-nucleoside phosphorylase
MTVAAFHPIDVILKKRSGGELSKEEIEQFVQAVVSNGEAKQAQLTTASVTINEEGITDAQIGSFLMAVFHHGLTRNELAHLTTAMRFSGEFFETKTLNSVVVDKHSTGGVGDKSSLLIAPILAAAGLEGEPSISVPMIAGRSLGHTGGTLDKLGSIPGFDCQLTLERAMKVLRECHATITGQTPRLVPADRMLYAMRDHTGTVESPYLITASIMSKKLAEGLDALVLDVKVGSGAFMPTYETSRLLAELMVSTGERAGTRTVALLTSMEEPLGRFSGNWLEVWECVDIMKGSRHAMSADLIELSLVLSGWLLYLAGKSATPEAGAALADDILKSGAANDAWLQIVRAQGGDTNVFDSPENFHRPAFKRMLHAPKNGFLSSMNCKEIGWAIQRLGAGRERPGDPVSAHAGIESHAKIGHAVEVGQPIFTLYSEQESKMEEGYNILERNVHFADTPPTKQPLVREIVQQTTANQQ